MCVEKGCQTILLESECWEGIELVPGLFRVDRANGPETGRSKLSPGVTDTGEVIGDYSNQRFHGLGGEREKGKLNSRYTASD